MMKYFFLENILGIKMRLNCKLLPRQNSNSDNRSKFEFHLHENFLDYTTKDNQINSVQLNLSFGSPMQVDKWTYTYHPIDLIDRVTLNIFLNITYDEIFFFGKYNRYKNEMEL